MYSTPLSWRIFPEKVYSPSRAATSTRMPYMRPRRSARAGRLSFSNHSQPSFHAPYTDASTALTASLTAVVAFTAFQYAQSECTDNNRRLPRPMCCVLDEAANICRWPELADVYSYFGSAGIPIMTIWQNPDQGKAAFGETNFGSLFNNANILVYLGGIKDAKWLGEISSLVGQREIVRGSLNIDGQGRRSVNNSIQKENILDVSDLAEWPVGRALVLASQCRAQIDRTMPWTENRVWADIIRKAA